MTKFSGLALTLFFLLTFNGELRAQVAFPTPLSQASSGQLQCAKPNFARKTCYAISGYRYGTNGAIENFYSTLLSGDPLVTMESTSPVEIRAQKVCGKTDMREIDTASFTIERRAADPGQTAFLRQKIKLALGGLLNREACVTFTPNGDARAKTTFMEMTLEGTPYPAGNQTVMWVSPADGYRVGP